MTENFDNGRVRTIWVINDDPSVFGVVDVMLREEGWEVASARILEFTDQLPARSIEQTVQFPVVLVAIEFEQTLVGKIFDARHELDAEQMAQRRCPSEEGRRPVPHNAAMGK
jgi:hypothetical protein